MDDFGINRVKTSIRARALQKLAEHSAKRPALMENGSTHSEIPMTPAENDFERLTKAISYKDISAAPMSGKEFEVLNSLAQSAKHLVSEKRASQLLHQLGKYLVEAPTQVYTNSPAVRRVKLSPWQLSTKLVCGAVITLGSEHQSLTNEAHDYVYKYLEKVNTLADKLISLSSSNEGSEFVSFLEQFFPFIFSIQGFLEASAKMADDMCEHANFVATVVDKIGSIINGNFLLAVERAISTYTQQQQATAHDALWIYSLNKYFVEGQQCGAMLINYYLSLFFKAVAKTFIETLHGKEGVDTHGRSLPDLIMHARPFPDLESGEKVETLTKLTKFATDQIARLDEGADYIKLGSPQEVDLALQVKSETLQIASVAVYHNLLELETALTMVKSSMTHEHEMAHHELALTVFKFASFLCLRDEGVVRPMTEFLPSFLLSGAVNSDLAWEATLAMVQGLKSTVQETQRSSTQEAIVGLIYKLMNMLTPDIDLVNGARFGSVGGGVGGADDDDESSIGSALPNNWPGSADRKVQIYRNVVTAAVAIATNYGEKEITVLASKVLTQKLHNVSRRLDQEVLIGLSKLAVHLHEKEFKLVLKQYTSAEDAAFKTDEQTLLVTISDARCNIAQSLKRDDPLYQVYLTDLLTGIVSKGDVPELEHHRPQSEISATAEEIAFLLPPLAALLPSLDQEPYEPEDAHIISLFRDAWFNMVVHGFSKNSKITKENLINLEIIAKSTPPLVSEVSLNKIESELELNTVLRRGSSHRNVNNQKEIMGNVFSQHFDFRSIQYPKLIFLGTTVLLESLRASTGNCSKVLMYFGDPGFRSGDTGKYMASIATDATKAYITKVIKGGEEAFTSEKVAKQLKEMLVLCCHRVKAIQNIAFTCADLIIKAIPSALCKQTSLFALLDLLTLLWSSCLDAETDEYEPRATFTSSRTNIRLELSDSYDHRRESMERLLHKADGWMDSIIELMSYDLKSLLVGYLAGLGEYRPISHVALGCSFAVDTGRKMVKSEGEFTGSRETQYTDSMSGFLSQYIWRTEFKEGTQTSGILADEGDKTITDLQLMLVSDSKKYSFEDIRDLLFRASSLLVDENRQLFVVRAVVKIPFKFFGERPMQLGISLWLWAINEVPKLKTAILSQIACEFEKTVQNKQGIYSQKYDHVNPEYAKMEYAPSSKAEMDHDAMLATRHFNPHTILIRFLSSVFQASNYESKHVLKIFARLSRVALEGLEQGSISPLVRSVRFELVRFGLNVLDVHQRFSAKICDSLKNLVIKSALSWFKQTAHWPYGGNRRKLRSDIRLLKEIVQLIVAIPIHENSYTKKHQVQAKRNLLVHFLNDELTRITAWFDPLQADNAYKKIGSSGQLGSKNVESAWMIDPVLAVHLVKRCGGNEAVSSLENLVARDPIKVVSAPDGLQYFIKCKSDMRRFLLFWAPVSPIESVNLFLPAFGADSIVLQYAMRSLESHDANNTFFYVPQIVQSLRYDKAGYIEQYILETAKLNQLFAHQIIWNVLANSYKDEDSTIPDELKPTLDRVIERMTSSFNDEEKSFYKREFDFFDEVTSISGKLKPFIKKTKAEKKAKIDEEIAKIKVDVGVYLPSNPDGEVVDIDRQSGKPLQSHAKAPFLATFKIRKEVADYDNDGSDEYDSSDVVEAKKTIDVNQSAIFKVGDDCRQDLLALQIIAVFRSIFKHSGLDLYVYPYRVTATAPGCGVIDVLPNSVSRDMLGREAVNGLYEYFTTKFGGEDSIEFQRARNNFVKSLAAYSVISYLIQFKDRHNGNIMYDNEGHILHIDFGFCFDIVPGGVKFEAAPFKLTNEMIAVMGGSTHTQAYRWFEELCIKAFLASRPYCETIIQVVLPMLDSGLPCFKGETTIKKLRARFVLDKTEREAALHFRSLIKKSYESMFTKGYDEFQRITNGIPY